MIVAEFTVTKGKPLVIISRDNDVIALYRFDVVDFNLFESIKNLRPSQERKFMLCFDERFKVFVDTLLLSYDDRIVRIEACSITMFELRGFYERWYNARCKV